MCFLKMNDLKLKNKKIFIRADLNVPIQNNKITSDFRITASLPTIKLALKQGARVMIASHLGRPIEGQYNHSFSLKPIVNYLIDKIDYPIRLVKNYLNGINFINKELIILENVRFNLGESTNNEILSKQYAFLCDIYVMDAFATAHRIHASTYGIAKFAPLACAGPLLLSEFKNVNKILTNPKHPVVIIIGGAKISHKFNILRYLTKIADTIIIGGGIANTFIAAKGYEIGLSLYEKKIITKAKEILSNNNNIILPTDVLVAKNFSDTTKTKIKFINDIQKDEYILDIGHQTCKYWFDILMKAKTILWIGPIGVFEFFNCRYGTKIIANTIANSQAYSIVGGGDTLAAIECFNIRNKFSYISTGGGSLLELIQNKNLPAINILQDRLKQ